MGNPQKILVVDDDPTIRHLLKTSLQNQGFEVEIAADGEEGLVKFKSFKPELLILDIMMPRMDGYTFLLELKKIADIRSVATIILTAKEQMRDIFKLEGVNDYIVKPFDMESLLRKIKKKLAVKKKKILVVDDERDVVDLIETRLDLSGYEVLNAYDGLSALEIAKSQKPDLIVLDIMMPKLDGFNICRMLKFDNKYKDIRVILLTARVQEEDRLLGQEVGADAYLTKPFDGEVLLHTIKQLLWD